MIDEAAEGAARMRYILIVIVVQSERMGEAAVATAPMAASQAVSTVEQASLVELRAVSVEASEGEAGIHGRALPAQHSSPRL